MGKPRFVQVRHPGCPGCSTDTAPSQNHSSCPKSCPVPWSSPYQCSMQEFCPHPPHSVPGGVRVQKQQFKNSFPGSAHEAGAAGPNCCPWETTVEPSGSGGIQLMREDVRMSLWKMNSCWVGASPGVTGNNAKSSWGKVDLSKNLSIPPPQHLARTRTCGIGKVTFQNKTKPSYRRSLK